MVRVRPPAVAGTFYPAEPKQLASDVASMLASVTFSESERLPKAIIVPHAGYVYSGPIAASAYARLRAGRDQVRRVVLLGPAHRVRVHGLALPDADAFDTPLGRIRVDIDAVAGLGFGAKGAEGDPKPQMFNPRLARNAAAHAREHSLEVELPFLQMVLSSFDVIPIAVGDAGPEEVAAVIEALWGGSETLIVVSSDLSHYLPYATAQAVDARTAQKVLALDGPLGYDEACGAGPINGLLLVARRKGLSRVALDIRTSGDTAGSRGEVVGYGAFAFYEG